MTVLPLSRQNVILYTYGCSLNLLTALVWRSLEGQSSVPFTRGPPRQTASQPRALSSAAQAASGYAIGALLKYVDAIGQVWATPPHIAMPHGGLRRRHRDAHHGRVFRVVVLVYISYVLTTQVTVSTLLFDLDMNFLYAVALLLSAALRRLRRSDLITTALEARRTARARQIALVPPKADAC